MTSQRDTPSALLCAIRVSFVVCVMLPAAGCSGDTPRYQAAAVQEQTAAKRSAFLDSLRRATDSIVAAQISANQNLRLAHQESGWGDGVPVRRADLGSAWPLTVASGRIKCRGTSGNLMLVFAAGGKEYALNGTAGTRYPDIDPIWRPDPRGYAPKMSIAPLLDYARNVCS